MTPQEQQLVTRLLSAYQGAEASVVGEWAHRSYRSVRAETRWYADQFGIEPPAFTHGWTGQFDDCDICGGTPVDPDSDEGVCEDCLRRYADKPEYLAGFVFTPPALQGDDHAQTSDSDVRPDS